MLVRVEQRSGVHAGPAQVVLEDRVGARREDSVVRLDPCREERRDCRCVEEHAGLARLPYGAESTSSDPATVTAAATTAQRGLPRASLEQPAVEACGGRGCQRHEYTRV